MSSFFQYLYSHPPTVRHAKKSNVELSKIDVCVLPVDSITTMQSCTDTNKECQIKSEDPTEETSCENKKEKTYVKFPE